MNQGRRKEDRRPAPARGDRVLVVDDAESVRRFASDWLRGRGFEVDALEDGAQALAWLEAGEHPDVVLLDIALPEQQGFAVLRRIHELDPSLPIIALSLGDRTQIVVEAMRLGAQNVLTKPIDERELEGALLRVLEKKRGQDARRTTREALAEGTPHVFESQALRRIRELIDQVADTDVTVLIQGESGVGKEIVARQLHERSSRATAPFVKVNCAALPDKLLESELFGYEQGAFTGALGRKIGKFEVADGGTLFLDEIGEMTPALQAKLLHVLQDHSFARLGGNRELRVDVRVLCATHRPLEDMVQAGSFREDLFYRLNVVNIVVPPLRERPADLPLLIETFLDRYSVQYEKPRPELSPELRRAFEHYSFPGNVRELENLLRRLIVLQDEKFILRELGTMAGGRTAMGTMGGKTAIENYDTASSKSVATVLGAVGGKGTSSSAKQTSPAGIASEIMDIGHLSAAEASSRFETFLDALVADPGDFSLLGIGQRAADAAERLTIARALAHTGWSRKRAAKLVGVSYKTLLQKVREDGLLEI